jgi:hypothetical protein
MSDNPFAEFAAIFWLTPENRINNLTSSFAGQTFQHLKCVKRLAGREQAIAEAGVLAKSLPEALERAKRALIA